MKNLPETFLNELQLHQQWLDSHGQSGNQLYIEDLDFSGMNLSGLNLAETNLVNTNFSNADLSNVDFFGANLSSSNFTQAILNGANLAKATLDYAQLRGASLQDSSLAKVSMYETDLTSADLSGSDLHHATVIHTTLDHTILRGCNLDGISFQDVKMDQVVFSGVRGSEHVFAKNVEIVDNGFSQNFSGEAFALWLRKHLRSEENQPYSWQDIKMELADALAQNKQAIVQIKILYPEDKSQQPQGLDVAYTIDGQTFLRTFRGIPEGYDANRKP